ncbi:hypothetical protein B0H13DRAFT_2391891 [Mycena leptocephala]|nr:hypothetical protein B0H13DRAFT_2391891 [Mycena leptocephala]
MNGEQRQSSGTSKPDQWYDQSHLLSSFDSFAIQKTISTACSPPKTRFDDPSHHLAALSLHDDTDSNSISPIFPSAIAPLPACPKPSFVCGPKSSMPRVEDVSVWLRWAVAPPRPCACSSSPRSSLSRRISSSSSCAPTSLPPFKDASPQWWCVPSSWGRHGCTSGALGDLALLVYIVVLFTFFRLMLSHSLFSMLAQKRGIRKAGKVARLGEQGYAVVYFVVVSLSFYLLLLSAARRRRRCILAPHAVHPHAPPFGLGPNLFRAVSLPPFDAPLSLQRLPNPPSLLPHRPYFSILAICCASYRSLTRSQYTLSTTPASFALKSRSPHFWLGRRWCVPYSDLRLPSMPALLFLFLGGGMVFGLCIDGARYWCAVLSCVAAFLLYSATFFSAAPCSFVQCTRTFERRLAAR